MTPKTYEIYNELYGTNITSKEEDMSKKKIVKLRDLDPSEIDRLDNIGVAVEALIEEEIRESNKGSVLTSGVNIRGAQAAIKALRRLFYEG